MSDPLIDMTRPILPGSRWRCFHSGTVRIEEIDGCGRVWLQPMDLHGGPYCLTESEVRDSFVWVASDPRPIEIGSVWRCEIGEEMTVCMIIRNVTTVSLVGMDTASGVRSGWDEDVFRRHCWWVRDAAPAASESTKPETPAPLLGAERCPNCGGHGLEGRLLCGTCSGAGVVRPARVAGAATADAITSNALVLAPPPCAAPDCTAPATVHEYCVYCAHETLGGNMDRVLADRSRLANTQAVDIVSGATARHKQAERRRAHRPTKSEREASKPHPWDGEDWP